MIEKAACTKVKGYDKVTLHKFIQDVKAKPERIQELQELAYILMQEALKVEDCQSPDCQERLESTSWHGNRDKPEKDYGTCITCKAALRKGRHARGHCKVCYARLRKAGKLAKSDKII